MRTLINEFMFHPQHDQVNDANLLGGSHGDGRGDFESSDNPLPGMKKSRSNIRVYPYTTAFHIINLVEVCPPSRSLCPLVCAVYRSLSLSLALFLFLFLLLFLFIYLFFLNVFEELVELYKGYIAFVFLFLS